MKKILSSPITLIVGVIAGGLTGIYCKPLASALKPFADIYMALLRMCVLPVVVCTITTNIGNLFNGSMKGTLKKWFLAVGLTMALSAAAGTALGFAFREFMAPSQEARLIIADMQKEKDDDGAGFTELSFYGVNEEGEEQEPFSIVSFLVNAAPTNIFYAMSEGDTLQVILFFAVLGIFLTRVEERFTVPILEAMEGIYNALCEFIEMLLLLLPFALYSLIAVQMSGNGMGGIILSSMKLVAVIYLSSLVIIGISFLAIRKFTGCSLKEHWMAVKRPLFIALGTSSCLSTLPVSMEGAVNHLRLNRRVVSSVMPVGITLCQSGIIACGAVAAVFATTIYDVTIDGNAVMIIMVGAVMFSISIIGVPGIVAVSMLSLILVPLGIPPEVIILIYLATVTIFDPICVFSSVYSNMAITAFTAGGKTGRRRGRGRRGTDDAGAGM